MVQGNLNEIKKSYGRRNVFVKCEGDVDDIIKRVGVEIVEKTPEEYRLRVTDDAQAQRLLRELSDAPATVVRFEMREPSLHEIFVEKATDEESEA